MRNKIFLQTMARCIGAIAIFLWLSGCAGRSTIQDKNASVENFELIGRIALSGGELYQPMQGQLFWRQTQEQLDVRLTAPLGQSLTLQQSKQQAQVNFAGQHYTAPNAEVLMTELLGQSLPLKPLSKWMNGQIQQGHNTSFASIAPLPSDWQQGEWHVRYQEWQIINGRQLPRRLLLTQGTLQVRILIDQWRVI